MALADFFSRTADAITPVAQIERDALARLLDDVRVTLVAGEHVTSDEAMRSGFAFAANLLARLYPRVSIVAPQPLSGIVREQMRAINPRISDGGNGEARQLCLMYGGRTPPAQADVVVDAWGWNVSVNVESSEADLVAPPAALAAAALGVGEIFRGVFGGSLTGGTANAGSAGILNLITEEAAAADIPVPSIFDVGSVHLAGAGAIGQAVIATWAECDVHGWLTVTDPEDVTLSNLQRYVLSAESDVGAAKTAVVERALAGSRMRVKTTRSRWGEDEVTGPHRETVAVALDSAQDRILVAAGLHRRVYNAWTQPSDIGWSRHENYGAEPCLACLYYPMREQPSDHELISRALSQPELRILAYLTSKQPIGAPLTVIPTIAGVPIPPEAARWLEIPLLVDLVSGGLINPDDAPRWQAKPVGAVYRDGICAGGIVPAGPVADDVVVPLAHQSALAGIMLAVQVLTGADPELRARRPTTPEGRFDVLRGLPQHIARPRTVTPGCFCQDADYQSAHAARWSR